jgi:hypothetical protein
MVTAADKRLKEYALTATVNDLELWEKNTGPGAYIRTETGLEFIPGEHGADTFDSLATSSLTSDQLRESEAVLRSMGATRSDTNGHWYYQPDKHSAEQFLPRCPAWALDKALELQDEAKARQLRIAGLRARFPEGCLVTLASPISGPSDQVYTLERIRNNQGAPLAILSDANGQRHTAQNVQNLELVAMATTAEPLTAEDWWQEILTESKVPFVKPSSGEELRRLDAYTLRESAEGVELWKHKTSDAHYYIRHNGQLTYIAGNAGPETFDSMVAELLTVERRAELEAELQAMGAERGEDVRGAMFWWFNPGKHRGRVKLYRNPASALARAEEVLKQEDERRARVVAMCYRFAEGTVVVRRQCMGDQLLTVEGVQDDGLAGKLRCRTSCGNMALVHVGSNLEVVTPGSGAPAPLWDWDLMSDDEIRAYAPHPDELPLLPRDTKLRLARLMGAGEDLLRGCSALSLGDAVERSLAMQRGEWVVLFHGHTLGRDNTEIRLRELRAAHPAYRWRAVEALHVYTGGQSKPAYEFEAMDSGAVLSSPWAPCSIESAPERTEQAEQAEQGAGVKIARSAYVSGPTYTDRAILAVQGNAEPGDCAGIMFDLGADPLAGLRRTRAGEGDGECLTMGYMSTSPAARNTLHQYTISTAIRPARGHIPGKGLSRGRPAAGPAGSAPRTRGNRAAPLSTPGRDPRPVAPVPWPALPPPSPVPPAPRSRPPCLQSLPCLPPYRPRSLASSQPIDGYLAVKSATKASASAMGISGTTGISHVPSAWAVASPDGGGPSIRT